MMKKESNDKFLMGIIDGLDQRLTMLQKELTRLNRKPARKKKKPPTLKAQLKWLRTLMGQRGMDTGEINQIIGKLTGEGVGRDFSADSFKSFHKVGISRPDLKKIAWSIAVEPHPDFRKEWTEKGGKPNG
jgi:uncharacterized small protein (DUF1192 family)